MLEQIELSDGLQTSNDGQEAYSHGDLVGNQVFGCVSGHGKAEESAQIVGTYYNLWPSPGELHISSRVATYATTYAATADVNLSLSSQVAPIV